MIIPDVYTLGTAYGLGEDVLSRNAQNFVYLWYESGNMSGDMVCIQS